MAGVLVIRELDARRAADLALWARGAAALWSDATAADHAAEIAATAGPERRAFAAEDPQGLAGFAEIGLRTHANGCESRPVPFLEGVWVAPRARRHGVGAALMAHVEQLLRAAGHREIGSDVVIGNDGSLAAHAAWGFVEVERVVCLRKDL